MEEKKKGLASRLEVFLAGKGFYIVLFLCVAIVGVSAWIMLAGTGTDVEDEPATVVSAVSTDRETVGYFDGESAQPEEDDAALESVEAPELTEPEALVLDEQPVEEAEETWIEAEPAVQESMLYIWPLVGEIENAYSVDALTYNRTMADWRIHDGVDIACEMGTQVKAVCSGKVVDIYDDDMYGTTVVIEHAGGLRSIYSNLADTPTVLIGDNVVTGDIIGAVGDTALCETGEVCHLHLAMSLDGASIDPTVYLPDR